MRPKSESDMDCCRIFVGLSATLVLLFGIYSLVQGLFMTGPLFSFFAAPPVEAYVTGGMFLVTSIFGFVSLCSRKPIWPLLFWVFHLITILTVIVWTSLWVGTFRQQVCGNSGDPWYGFVPSVVSLEPTSVNSPAPQQMIPSSSSSSSSSGPPPLPEPETPYGSDDPAAASGSGVNEPPPLEPEFPSGWDEPAAANEPPPLEPEVPSFGSEGIVPVEPVKKRQSSSGSSLGGLAAGLGDLGCGLQCTLGISSCQQKKNATGMATEHDMCPCYTDAVNCYSTNKCDKMKSLTELACMGAGCSSCKPTSASSSGGGGGGGLGFGSFVCNSESSTIIFSILVLCVQALACCPFMFCGIAYWRRVKHRFVYGDPSIATAAADPGQVPTSADSGVPQIYTSGTYNGVQYA